MTDTSMVPRKRDAGQPLVDEELADQLLGKARAEGAELLGPDGLLSQVTKAVLERALAEEMTDHLGYEKHGPAGRGNGSSREGSTPKTLMIDAALGRADPDRMGVGPEGVTGFWLRHDTAICARLPAASASPAWPQIADQADLCARGPALEQPSGGPQHALA